VYEGFSGSGPAGLFLLNFLFEPHGRRYWWGACVCASWPLWLRTFRQEADGPGGAHRRERERNGRRPGRRAAIRTLSESGVGPRRRLWMVPTWETSPSRRGTGPRRSWAATFETRIFGGTMSRRSSAGKSCDVDRRERASWPTCRG